jgi:hypothetical protein
MTDWGVPDWTKEKDYPAPRGPGEMYIWAWEFLRRWNEYRTFWTEKIEPFIDGRGWICRDANGIWWPHLDELETRFGVYSPSPPQSTTPSRFTAYSVRWVEGGETQEVCLGQDETSYIIDLSRPLESQFGAAIESARREQNLSVPGVKRARRRVEHYIPYLRILDALEAGVASQDIAERLFPKLSDERPACCRQKRLVDYRQAAEKLRGGGYRSLLIA